MRRVTLAVALMILLSTGAAATEQSVTLNPIAWVLRIYHVQYERKIDDNSSFVVLGGLLSTEDPVEQQNGTLARIGYRRYLGGGAPEGVFVEGSGWFEHRNYTYDDYYLHQTASVTSLGASVYGGIKTVFKRGVTTEIGIGVVSTVYSAGHGYVSVEPGGVTPSMILSVGYSW